MLCYLITSLTHKILLISDINECLQPNICKANCHNIEGSFYCTECPRGTEYDLDKMQCTTTKQQILLSGKTKLLLYLIKSIKRNLKELHGFRYYYWVVCWLRHSSSEF